VYALIPWRDVDALVAPSFGFENQEAGRPVSVRARVWPFRPARPGVAGGDSRSRRWRVS